MGQSRIIIKDATADDAQFVGECVLAAIDLNDFKSGYKGYEYFIDIASRDDTLYSYRNARLATVEGIPVGCLVSYPGNTYSEGRKKTFPMFELDDPQDCLDAGIEAYPGEYYLDSLAVLPAYRGFDLGKLLLKDGIEKGRRLGFRRISLIVESDKPKLQEYYTGLGFKPENEIMFFGHLYTRMLLDL